MPIMGQASGERWTIIERKSKIENQIEDCKMGCNNCIPFIQLYLFIRLFMLPFYSLITKQIKPLFHCNFTIMHETRSPNLTLPVPLSLSQWEQPLTARLWILDGSSIPCCVGIIIVQAWTGTDLGLPLASFRLFWKASMLFQYSSISSSFFGKSSLSGTGCTMLYSCLPVKKEITVCHDVK